MLQLFWLIPAILFAALEVTWAQLPWQSGVGTPVTSGAAFTGLIDCTGCGSITPAIFWGARAPSFAQIGANSFDVGCNATATASVQFTAVYAANGYHDSSFASNSCASTRWLIKAYDSSGSTLCTGAACNATPGGGVGETPTFVQVNGHWCMAFDGNATGGYRQFIYTGAVTASDKGGAAVWAKRATGSTSVMRIPSTSGNFDMRFSASADRVAIQGSAGTDIPASGSNATENVYHSIIGVNQQSSSSYIMVDGGTANTGDVGSGAISSGFSTGIGYVSNVTGTGIVCELAMYFGATVGTNLPDQTQAAAMNTNQAAAW